MQRILVIKLSALGDLFHAVPVVHLLADHYGCKVDWVTQPEYAELVKCHEDVDRVITFPRKGGLSDSKRFLKQLRIRHYDLALDLQGLTKSGMILGLCRSKRKIGFSVPREISKWFAKEQPKVRKGDPHSAERLMDSLAYLGINTDPVRYPLRFPEIIPPPAFHGKIVALAPRSRWKAKDWPVANYISLGEKLLEKSNRQIWVLGGPDDRNIGEEIQIRLGEPCLNLCGSHPLVSLGTLLKNVDCVVSNDSGPMHFAAALDRPLVALFGPTDPALTGPRSSRAQILRSAPPDTGYPDHRSYKSEDTSLIENIKVSEVFSAVEAQLEKEYGM